MGASLPPPIQVETMRLVMIAAAALLAATIGLVSVLRDEPAPQGFTAVPQASAAQAPAAVRYSELRAKQDPAALGFHELGMKQLREALPGLSEPVVQTPADREAALLRRAHNRAYDGAPPTIPHAVDQRAKPSCLACHQSGLKIAGRIAPAMSHQPYKSCLQCHVVQEANSALTDAPFGGNGFESVGFERKGARAWTGAPPVVPHSSWMREKCRSCHGVSGALGVRSTHPARLNCKQCHALSADFEQRDFGALSARAP